MGKIIDVEGITGISDDDSLKRLKEEGYNELPCRKNKALLPYFCVLFVNRCCCFFLAQV